MEYVHPALLFLRYVLLVCVVAATIAIAMDYFAHERAYNLFFDTIEKPRPGWGFQEFFVLFFPWLVFIFVQVNTIRKRAWYLDVTRVASLLPAYFAIYLSWNEFPMWWGLGNPPMTEGVPTGDFDIGLSSLVALPISLLTALLFGIYKSWMYYRTSEQE